MPNLNNANRALTEVPERIVREL